MAAKTKRKRKATSKQLAALRKARAARRRKISPSRSRKKRVISKRKRTARSLRTTTDNDNAVVVINQGANTMRKRRRTVKKRKSPRRKSRYLSGTALRIPKARQIQTMVMDTGVSTAGAIGVSVLASKIPVKNPKVKAFIPLIIGIVAEGFAKGRNARIIGNAALGARVAGGLALLKQFAPNSFALAGENEMYNQYIDEQGRPQSLLGLPADYMGIPTDYMGQGDADVPPEYESSF